MMFGEGALSLALHSAGYARPAQGNVAARSHLPRSLPPCHPLRLAMCSQPRPPPPVPSALRPRTPTRSLSAHRCANFSQHLLHAAERMLLSAFAGRLREAFRVRASPQARWSLFIHAACGVARLASVGRRSEERDRAVCVTVRQAIERTYFDAHVLVSRVDVRLSQ